MHIVAHSDTASHTWNRITYFVQTTLVRPRWGNFESKKIGFTVGNRFPLKMHVRRHIPSAITHMRYNVCWRDVRVQDVVRALCCCYRLEYDLSLYLHMRVSDGDHSDVGHAWDAGMRKGDEITHVLLCVQSCAGIWTYVQLNKRNHHRRIFPTVQVAGCLVSIDNWQALYRTIHTHTTITTNDKSYHPIIIHIKT